MSHPPSGWAKRGGGSKRSKFTVSRAPSPASAKLIAHAGCAAAMVLPRTNEAGDAPVDWRACFVHSATAAHTIVPTELPTLAGRDFVGTAMLGDAPVGTHVAAEDTRLDAAVALLRHVAGEAERWRDLSRVYATQVDARRDWALAVAALVQLRTDDPDGIAVGAVAYDADTGAVVGIGWNGYAANTSAQDYAPALKLHTMIHAEQSLLLRHRFPHTHVHLVSTREPCHECAPLCVAARVAHVTWLWRAQNGPFALTYAAEQTLAAASIGTTVLNRV
jgi:deoxycytidylate deaminase